MSRLAWAILLLNCTASVGLAQAPDKVQGKTAAEWIETLRTHKDAKFRRASLIILGVFGPRVEGVLPAVTEALEKDADELNRRAAAGLLDRMAPDSKGSVYALGSALKSDKSPSVREAAALALNGNLNPFAAEQIMILAGALTDEHGPVADAASHAIYKLSDKANLVLPAVIAAAKNPKSSRFCRQYALKTIAKIGVDDRDIADILVATLRDKTAHVSLREEAAEGLGKSTVAADVVIVPLAESLADGVVEVRRAASAALARQGKDAEIAWPKIEAALKDTKGKDADQAVRYQLIRSAGQLAKSKIEAVKALIHQAQHDPHAENRLAAIQELGQITELGRDEVVAALTSLSEDDANPAIRSAAAAALKKIQEG